MALTIAGSDSGGGAGIQADLKTFAALGVFGTSAITCVTAQNPDRVSGVEAVSPRMAALQIRAVCEGFPVAAAKTGMLYSAAMVRAVADAVTACRLRTLVVDPVMVATSGARLLRDDAVRALCDRLLPLAAVITPNVPEAEVLLEADIRSPADQREGAIELHRRFGAAVVLKGGHLGNPERRGRRGDAEDQRVVDVLAWRGRTVSFRAPRVAARETHGSGCTFSAALTAGLARGEDLETAVARAQKFVVRALREAVRVGRHYPLRFGP